MNTSLCASFLHHLDDGGLEVGAASDEIQAWLTGIGLPIELLHLLQDDWPQADGDLGEMYLVFSSESIRADEMTPPLQEARFLNVGSAVNGDFFVIDFASEACIPGYVSHEEWSPDEDPPLNPRDFFQPIARSFESLLYRLVEGRFVPIDYYAAEEFNRLLKDEETEA